MLPSMATVGIEVFQALSHAEQNQRRNAASMRGLIEAEHTHAPRTGTPREKFDRVLVIKQNLPRPNGKKSGRFKLQVVTLVLSISPRMVVKATRATNAGEWLIG